MKLVAIIRNRVAIIKSDNDFGEIFSGSILAMISKVFATLIGLAASVLIARYYGAETLGVLALIESYFAIVTVFTLMGTNTSILRLIPEYSIKYSPFTAQKMYYKTLTFVGIVTIAICIILFFGSGFIADNLFKRPDLKFLFSIAAIVLFFRTMQQFSLHGIRALKKIKAYAFFNSLRPFIFLLLILIFLGYKDLIYMPVYLQYIAFSVVAILSFVYVRYIFSKVAKEKNKGANITYSEIFKVSWPMFLTASMMVIIGNLATLMIGIFDDETEVGYYSISFKIASLTVFILASINTIVAPKFSELFHSQKIDQLFSVARKSTKLIFWSTMPLLLVFIFFGKDIIILFYGSEFIVCYSPLLILVVGLFISAISGSVGHFMNMCGYEKQFKNIMLISLIANVLLSLLLIPRYGAIGAAISTSVTQIIWNLVATIFIYMKYDKTFIYIPLFYR